VCVNSAVLIEHLSHAFIARKLEIVGADLKKLTVQLGAALTAQKAAV